MNNPIIGIKIPTKKLEQDSKTLLEHGVWEGASKGIPCMKLFSGFDRTFKDNVKYPVDNANYIVFEGTKGSPEDYVEVGIVTAVEWNNKNEIEWTATQEYNPKEHQNENRRAKLYVEKLHKLPKALYELTMPDAANTPNNSSGVYVKQNNS